MGQSGFRNNHEPVRRCLVVIWAVFFACATGPALSQSTLSQSTLAQETKKSLGTNIEPLTGFYQVLKGVNVRNKPLTGGKKIGKLKKGSRIDVLGKVKGAPWLAVAKDGKAYGFVYAPMLMPLIDGALKKNLTGRTPDQPGPACDYTIRFEGKSAVEGDLFKTADYEVDFTCPYKGKEITFSAFMFITEAPYQMSTENLVHQIGIDLREIGEDFEKTFSTILFYHRNTRKLAFDSVTLKDYGRAPVIKKTSAQTVAEALHEAVRMAVSAWNDKVWKELAEDRP